MRKAQKVLFISAPVGAGHIRAAEAIAEALTQQYPQIETKLANVFDFLPPALGNFILRTYLRVLKIFPQLYGAAYNWGNESKLALMGRKIISRFLAGRMRKYINSYSPALIVCTHATPAGLVAYLAGRGELSVPTVAVVTDFVVHRLWVYPELGHYFVAHEKMRQYLARHGVSLEKSQAAGIPVQQAFMRAANARLKPRRGVPKRVLIMGGGAGVMPMDKIITACDALEVELEFIAVTGNNKAMYHKLLQLKPTLKHTLKVLGFVNNVHELMAAADLLISKPGGLTAAEALFMNLPMLIYKPIPGQEEGNTQVLLDHSVAVRADSLNDVKRLVEQLLTENSRLDSMREHARRLGKPQAAETVANYIAAAINEIQLDQLT